MPSGSSPMSSNTAPYGSMNSRREYQALRAATPSVASAKFHDLDRAATSRRERPTSGALSMARLPPVHVMATPMPHSASTYDQFAPRHERVTSTSSGTPSMRAS